MGSVGRGGKRLGSVTQLLVDICSLYFFSRWVGRSVGRSVGRCVGGRRCWCVLYSKMFSPFTINSIVFYGRGGVDH